jgi:hypothetical protein
MSSAHRSARRENNPFDWGEADELNVDLTTNIIDVAIESGFPWNGALFQLSCLSWSFKKQCLTRINKQRAHLLRLYAAMRKALQEWLEYEATFYFASKNWEEWQGELNPNARPVRDTTAKSAYNAAITEFRIAAVHRLGQGGDLLVKRLEHLHRKQLEYPENALLKARDSWLFDFDHKTLAHAVQQKCMMCTGQCKACLCNATTCKQRLDHGEINTPWQWRVFDGTDLTYCRPSCITDQVVERCNLRLKTLHRWPPDHECHRRRTIFRTWTLGKALLHQKDYYEKYEIDRVLAENFTDSTKPVLLLQNKNFKARSLQEVLQINNLQLKHALNESCRLMTVRNDELEAARDVRIKKLRLDCDLFMTRHLGKTVADIGRTLPTLQSTLQRLLFDADSTVNSRYVDASQFPMVRGFMCKLVALERFFSPMDSELRGEDHERHSTQAYEWLFDLTMGALPGEAGPWRVDSSIDVLKYWCKENFCDTHRVPTDQVCIEPPYMVAAANVFDAIGSKFSLTVEVRKIQRAMHALVWVLRHSTGWCICGKVAQRSYSDASQWHKMVTGCFQKEHVDKLESDDHADFHLRHMPYQENWRTVLSKPTTPDLSAIGAVRDYYEEVAGTLVLFPHIRHAGLLLLGIRPIKIGNALCDFHTDWALKEVHVPGQPQCPQSARDFALWVCGNPAKHPIRWHRAPQPPPVPPLPEPGEDLSTSGLAPVESDSDDSSSSNNGMYFPTSPQYSSTAPHSDLGSPRHLYYPASPQYSPGGGEESDDEEEDSPYL